MIMFIESMADVLKIEVYQSDWMPGFAAFLDDGKINESAKAHIALNLACFLATIEQGDIEPSDLPYVIAETIMHEVMHALEAWAGVEFSEERVEDLLTKYREVYSPDSPRYVKCEERESPDDAVYGEGEIARLRQRTIELETVLRYYQKPCPYCDDILCGEKCKAACAVRYNNLQPSLPPEPFVPES